MLSKMFKKTQKEEDINKKDSAKDEKKISFWQDVNMDGLEYLWVLKWGEGEDDEHAMIRGMAENRPEIKFWNWLLKTALEKDVTDIHFEPELVTFINENGEKIESWKIIIRFNINGEKIYFYELQPEIYNQIIRVVKDKNWMLADETSIQQNWSGEVSAVIDWKIIKKRLRFSVIPTVYLYEDLDVKGLWNTQVENMVVRLLANKIYNLEELGLWSYEPYLTSALQETWAILFTWPTSHGKTTTQVAALDFIRRINPKRKYYTVENPVEIIVSWIANLKDKKYIPWITPIQIADRLQKKDIQQHLLRWNPDVIVIWELTQNEDIQFAKNMANTGHTVVWTMHTESTTELKTRLESENINYDSFIQIVKLIISQRLLILPYKTISIANFKKKYENYKKELVYRNFLEEWEHILKYNVLNQLIRPNILWQNFYNIKNLLKLEKSWKLKNSNIKKLETYYKYLEIYLYWNEKYKEHDEQVLNVILSFIEKNLYIADVLTNNEKIELVKIQFTEKEIEEAKWEEWLFNKLMEIKWRFSVFEFATLSDPLVKKHFMSKDVSAEILNEKDTNFLTIFQDAFIKSLLFGGEWFSINNEIKSFDLMNDTVLKGLSKHNYGINKFIKEI